MHLVEMTTKGRLIVLSCRLSLIHLHNKDNTHSRGGREGTWILLGPR